MEILINLFLPLAVLVIMFSLGLGLEFADFGRVFKRPKAFAVGAAAQLIALPLAALCVAIVFRLPPVLAFGLMLLSFCPGGATSNFFTKMAHGDVALSISLTGVVTLISVITVPVLVRLSAGYFLGEAAPTVNVTLLGLELFALTAIPAAAGIAMRRYAARLTARIERPVATLSIIVVAVVILGAVATNWSLFVSQLAVLGPSVIALNVVMLGLGLALGYAFVLTSTEATTIAIEVGIQSSVVGITVGTLIAGSAAEMPDYSLPSGVYGVTMYLVVMPFIWWRRSRRKTA